jgi:hypothetical protein
VKLELDLVLKALLRARCSRMDGDETAMRWMPSPDVMVSPSHAEKAGTLVRKRRCSPHPSSPCFCRDLLLPIAGRGK